MKLIEDNNKHTIIGSDDTTYYELMKIKKDDKQYTCFSNLNDIILVNQDLTEIISGDYLNEKDLKTLDYFALDRQNKNDNRLKNLILYERNFKRYKKNYDLLKLKDKLLAIAIPFPFIYTIANNDDLTLSINKNDIIKNNQILLYKIEDNKKYLTTSIMKKIMFETLLFKDDPDYDLIETLNNKRNKLLQKSDNFTDIVTSFVRKKK